MLFWYAKKEEKGAAWNMILAFPFSIYVSN
ncbi:hypothetical protein B14911_24285 [Bacillus sp. NRRL B-14911]|uniref:Uncharacterized protein n=1 Tax=Bacillus infantis NRRL B-14911 TaxID=1367477 RepID=U5LDL4_9BACI|nr:hypothetical protein N288_20335 [Bacillus infantis NRRL B-14911]EAR64761.1 hypothetical protein B14911_24285 [Bacillus sp. NRRL B-14911]